MDSQKKEFERDGGTSNTPPPGEIVYDDVFTPQDDALKNITMFGNGVIQLKYVDESDVEVPASTEKDEAGEDDQPFSPDVPPTTLFAFTKRMIKSMMAFEAVSVDPNLVASLGGGVLDGRCGAMIASDAQVNGGGPVCVKWALGADLRGRLETVSGLPVPDGAMKGRNHRCRPAHVQLPTNVERWGEWREGAAVPEDAPVKEIKGRVEEVLR